MKLWTLQHINFYNQLQETGVAYTPVRSEIWNVWPWAYQWMVEQMKERLGEPPIPEIFTPVWAWYQYDSKKKCRPPYSPKDTNNSENVMLELEVPDELVLLSDFNLWLHPLGGWDLAPKAESKILDKEIEDYCGKTYYNFEDLSLDLQGKIRQTWVRVFDLQTRDSYYAPKHVKNRSVQATLWMVRKEWVRSAVKMTVDEKKNVKIQKL